jgi:hypothetical protein
MSVGGLFHAGPAGAAPCDTWTGGSGNWNVGSNWSAGVPSSTTAVCITTAGSYTVTVNDSEFAASLTVGAASGTQPELLLASQGGVESAYLQVAGDISNGATIDLSSQGAGAAETTTLNWAGTLINSGTLATDVGTSKGTRYLEGDIASSSAINISAPTVLDQYNAQFDNAGALTVASTGSVDLNGPIDFTNDTGGSISNSGTFTAEGDSLFTQGAGTVSGTAVVINNATLIDAGTGAGGFQMEGSDTLVGNVASGQTLTLAGVTGTTAVTVTAPGSFTNAGTIVLTDVGKTNQSSEYADLEWSGTLTNTGTLSLQPGVVSDYRYLYGNLHNQGTVTVSSPLAEYQSYGSDGALLTNSKTFTVASGGVFTANYADVVNSGGSINDTGNFVLVNGVFEEGAGKTTGNAVNLTSSSTLDFIGGGASKFVFTQSGELVGNIASGQFVTVAGVTATNDTYVTAPGSFTNAGTITLTTQGATSGSNQVAELSWSGTLTNSGSITATKGTTGGARYLEGQVLSNSGNIGVNVSVQADTVGKWINNGTVSLVAGQKLTFTNTTRFLQGSTGVLSSGVTAGAIGSIVTSGPVSLAGTLTITGTPTSGKTYTLLTGTDGIQGTFTTVNPAVGFTVHYAATTVKVTAA